MIEPEDHWSCIAHLSAEDILKSAVTEEKKFKHSPSAGADNPLGPKFWCQQEGLSLLSFATSLKKNLFEVWFFTIFFYDFMHVYSPGAGADSPQGTKFWCQQKCLVTSFIYCKFPKKCLVTSFICCKFQKNAFEVWFFTFFSWFNTYI